MKTIGNPKENHRKKHWRNHRKTTGNKRRTNGKPEENLWKPLAKPVENHRKTRRTTIGKQLDIR